MGDKKGKNKYNEQLIRMMMLSGHDPYESNGKKKYNKRVLLIEKMSKKKDDRSLFRILRDQMALIYRR